MKYFLTLFVTIATLMSTSFAQSKEVNLKVGDKAPVFSLPDLDNNYVFLRDYSGEKLRKPWKNKTKYAVVISFFATWCGPCKKEIPYLEKLHDQFKGKDIRFFLIDVGEERGKIDQFLKQDTVKLKILHDRYKQTSTKFGANSLPRLIVIDKQGTIQLVKRGFNDGKAFMKEMTELLSKLI